jgi:hypothetical protein
LDTVRENLSEEILKTLAQLQFSLDSLCPTSFNKIDRMKIDTESQIHTSPLLSESEWNFDNVPDDEIFPAFMWETLRELDIEQDIRTARAWLAGKLSEKRPQMLRDKNGMHPRYNRNFSEADIARFRIEAIFGHFIPISEFYFSWKMSGLEPVSIPFWRIMASLGLACRNPKKGVSVKS